MIPIATTFRYMLWSLEGHFSGASDEFLVEGYRVQLMGTTLELSFEARGTCSQNSAKVLAEKYNEAISKHLGRYSSLMTEEEWLKRTTPPFGAMRTISINLEDRNRSA